MRKLTWRFIVATLVFLTLSRVGLSLWRFNVGAGSSEQGEASGIKEPLHRTECFLQADGRFDWSRQAGQRWFSVGSWSGWPQ